MFQHLVLLLLLLSPGYARASQTTAERAANDFAQREIARAVPEGNLPEYSLPPAELVKAQHLAAVHRRAHFAAKRGGVVQLLLLLALGGVARLRSMAVRVSRYRFVQGYSFAFLFLASLFMLNLPLELYLHHLSRTYGISIQGFTRLVCRPGERIPA